MSEKSNTYAQILFPTYQCLVCEKYENPNALVADTARAWLCPECKQKLRKMMEVSEDA